jgi:pimeloyl-[acyl-carrier protein] methyl ester esterase
MGGQAALAWAHRAPRQVSRLALIATTPSFVRRDHWPHAVEAAVLREFAQALTADREGTLRRFLALQLLGDAQARKAAAGLRAHLLRGARPPAAVLADGLALLLSTDLRAILGAIAQPALVLHGDRDRLAPLAAGEFLSAALLNARLAVVKGAAHAPFVSKARETGALLEAFFHER